MMGEWVTTGSTIRMDGRCLSFLRTHTLSILCWPGRRRSNFNWILRAACIGRLVNNPMRTSRWWQAATTSFFDSGLPFRRCHSYYVRQNMKDHCNQCGTGWDVPDSINWEDSQWDPCGELPIKQLHLLRDRYGASEYDAKSIAGHIPWSGGRCHNCSRRIPRGWVTCDGCGATNYNFHGPLTIAQRLHLRPNPLLKPNQLRADPANRR